MQTSRGNIEWNWINIHLKLTLFFLCISSSTTWSQIMVTNTSDSGAGSLRQAILDANANIGTDFIQFNIAGSAPFTIQPSSALPTITGPVTIDGTTQSGYSDVPLIEIEGTNAGSGAHGLHFVGGSATCTIKALVINRFSGNGIYIQYNGSKTIQGCYIGTDTTGTVNQGNGGGIVIENVGGNTIGGTSSVLRNTISGNSIGIYIAGSSATGNLIQNNFIGTDVTGTDDLGNTQSGIRLESGATGNQIGGTSSGMRNIISGNDQYGIHLLSSDSNTILGNFIGTDSTGTSAIGNTTHGIYIYNSASNTIGGTATGAGNVISANGGTGTAYNIYVDESNSDNNKIWGNYIGMDVGGTFLLGPTSQTGIMIKDGTGNHIGSNTSSSRNIISTTGTGIRLYNCSGNFIRGNYIGTNAAGTVAIASTGIGIYFISNATANTIGGDASGTGNVISGWGDGIYINSGCNSNTIQGNLIGTDADGDEILSNTGNGIRIQSNSNTVGGSTSLTRNVISGNGSNGIWIFSGGSNTIQGNYIGTDSSGTEDLGNTGPGILISGSSNEIGGSGSGEGNLIAYNGGDGIDASSGTGNLLSRNAIHSNSGLGIDLGSNGVTANDAGDSDTGANNLQNYPVIDSVAIDANTTIYWQLHSAPSTTYIVEFFYSSSPDPTGYGEGKSYLGTDGTTTDGSGNAAGEISIFSSIPEGSYITATATDPSDNTSEFSESAWEPGVTSHTPTQHAVDIDTSSNIQIIFNDDIDGTTINDDLTFNVDGSQSGEHQGTFSGGGTNTMTFDPIGSFEPGEVVTVTLTTGIQRTGGGSMADPYTFQFTIAAEEAPGVFHGDTITTNADRVFAACAADIDGDGDLDAVTASYTDDKVAWFENGNSWSEHVITTTADGADDVWAADLDGDGDMDVLAAGYKDNTIAWYENGNSWNKTVITTNTIIAKSVRVGDMDGDGDLDVVSASSTDNKIAWFENGNSWSETVISTGANTAKWVHVADIDSDGDLDVLSASEGDSKIAWYENGNSWNITVISTSANNAESVHAADIDGDGDLDVLSSSRMDNKIAWYENGNSWTETAISVHDSGACNVITADLDGDGDLDVATASQYDDTIRWYENGNGWSKTVIDTGLTGVNGIHTADLDNDGDMDLLAAVPNVPSVRWYENGSITVTAPNGGESWEAGDNRNITWTSSGIAGPITIECSTDSGSTWSEVAASTDNDGSYTWPVPATDSDKCLILISTADGWPRDTSDAVFTITLPPVDAPENLTIQAESGQVTVRWDQNSEPKLHKYNIYRDIYPPATTLIDSVVASSPPDTFYVDTDVTNGQQYYYRITAVDSLNTESDYSNEVVDRPGGGLVAYYPFNGDADDESGKGHNGTVHGATLTTDKFGGSDCAYSFDGDNDYISIPDNADQRIRPPLSIAFWINPDDYSSSGRYILSKGDASFRHYYFSINTVGAITFGVEGYDQNTVLSTTTLTTSQWYHIVGIHDGFTLKLYIDGSLDSMETATNLGNPSHNQYLNFGIDQSNLYSSKFFDGCLDEVRIYSRVLSADEIDSLYTDFSKPKTPQNLTAQSTNSRITLQWDRNGEYNLHKYNIYRNTYPPAATLIDSVVASSPPDTFYVDTDVTEGQQYYYRITAVDSLSVESDFSGNVVTRPGGGLVAYYPFNGNADDESGNNHDGTVTGPVLTADKFGEPDCAYSFDGSNDYISIPDNADQRIRPPLSIAFWINPDDYSSSGRFILSKGDAAFRHYYFSINTVGAVTFGVEGYDQNTVLSTTTLNTSRWYHIVGIHDGFTLKLYVDGSLDSMETATNLGNPNHNQFLNFGIDQSNLYSSKFFDGRLDEVRIYSKALSLLEIDTLYNEFSKPSIPQNLVAVPGNGQVKISWNANPENTIHKYNIYRDTISPAATLIDSVVAASPPDTFYTDTDVTNGQHYYYRISAVDSSGRESSMSAEADAVPSDVIQVQVKVFLQGPYKAAGDTMTAILCPDSMDVIPLTSPHTEDARIVAEIPSGITDWVLVQLRTSKTGAAVVSRSAFLRKDGCIVADDGSTNYITMSADPGDYFIVVQHRNHLAVMSDEVHTLSIGSSSLYDFTTGLDKYEQSYAAFLEEGVYGMYAGDANHNQQVQNDDKNDYWKIQVGLAGYRSADFSLNGQVQNDDKNDIWKLNVGKGSQVIDP